MIHYIRLSLFLSVNSLLYLTTPSLSLAKMSTEQEDFRSAIQDTKEMMSNKYKREEAIRGDSSASKAHQEVLNLTGGNPEMTEDFFKVSGEILDTLGTKYASTPEELQDLIYQLQKDPKSIEKMLTPNQLNAIREVAGKIESKSSKEGARKP